MADNPENVPGFLPSKLWIINEASGKLRYDIEDAIRDFLQCGNIQINNSVPVFYPSENHEINRFLQYKVNNFGKRKRSRNLRRKNCQT